MEKFINKVLSPNKTMKHVRLSALASLVGLLNFGSGCEQKPLSPESRRVQEAQRLSYPDWMEEQGYKVPDSTLEGLRQLHCGKSYKKEATSYNGSHYTLRYNPPSTLELRAEFIDQTFAREPTHHTTTYKIDNEGIATPTWDESYPLSRPYNKSKGNTLGNPPMLTWMSGIDPNDEMSRYNALFYKQGVQGLTVVFNKYKDNIRNCSR